MRYAMYVCRGAMLFDVQWALNFSNLRAAAARAGAGEQMIRPQSNQSILGLL
jgi:hypothetical protein